MEQVETTFIQAATFFHNDGSCTLTYAYIYFPQHFNKEKESKLQDFAHFRAPKQATISVVFSFVGKPGNTPN